jgi:hypothetical protein
MEWGVAFARLRGVIWDTVASGCQVACSRLVTAKTAEQSEEWVSGGHYLNVEELFE